MSMSGHRESARIYEFPRRIRAATGEQRRNDNKPVVLQSMPFPQIEFGSCWYHEAAVQDADQTRKS